METGNIERRSGLNRDLFEKDVLFYNKKEGTMKWLAYRLYLKYAQAGIALKEKFGTCSDA